MSEIKFCGAFERLVNAANTAHIRNSHSHGGKVHKERPHEGEYGHDEHMKRGGSAHHHKKAHRAHGGAVPHHEESMDHEKRSHGGRCSKKHRHEK